MLPVPNEKNLTLFKKYFYEIALFGLTGCVVYLFMAYRDLNNYIRDEFIKHTVETRVSITENTRVLKETQHLLTQKTENK